MSEAKSNQLPVSKEDSDRFWGQVEKDDQGCWTWAGSKNSKGYGRFFLDGRHLGAHRVSWQLSGRALQSNLQIVHTCANNLCVNPDHLVMGAEASNRGKRNRDPDGRPKAKKPHADFPLFPHATGRWAKKIKRKLHYFGSTVDDPNGEAALARYLDTKDDLQAGRKPRKKDEGALTVRDLCNRFLTSKQRQLDSGEITQRTFGDYRFTTDRLIGYFGKSRAVEDIGADDFELLRADIATTRGAVSLGTEIQRIRTIFKYAYDNRLINEPIRYGTAFRKPSKKVLRRVRAGNGKRLFANSDVRKLIDNANIQIKAMLLLGINCGFGNGDCANLPIDAIDFEGGWIEFPRPKTGIERKCALWPETVDALKAAIAARPQPTDERNSRLVFITKYGSKWVANYDNAISKETRKLLDDLQIYRKGLTFYTLRHTFRTVADATRDFPAVNHVMGHNDDTISAVYRESIDDDRLIQVSEHVRAWLFGENDQGDADAEPEAVTDAAEADDTSEPEADSQPLRLFVG